MAFKKAKQQVIHCLQNGNVSHETRGNIDVKNLLATGAVTIDEVISIILRAKGGDYSCSPHHFDSNVPMHLIKTVNSGKTWYIKWYILDPDAVFISVHN
ncbi:MAG: hypothetical protein OEV42_07025 [Deltaproteobacteria bacterium]|nr:hypothetical protein [Deltaproteobacteria bacterium]